MKKRVTSVGTIVGALCLVAVVAISQNSKPVAMLIETPSNESWSAENATLLSGRASSAFYYGVGSRFLATITKEKLDKATSINNILPPEADWSSYKIENITVKRLANDAEISKVGGELIFGGLSLNESQIELLRKCEYSESFRLLAKTYIGDNLNYFITVVPEKEASYTGGSEALLAYLMKNSVMDIIDVAEEKLKPGRIMFTINTKGEIADISLSESSGYNAVDKTMMKLINETSGSWEPAKNGDGAKVDQELMFSFGKIGC